MPGEPDGHGAEEDRGDAREGEGGGEAHPRRVEPRRAARRGRDERGGIGRDPDEGRLPERGQAGDAGQEDEAEGDEGVQAHVGEEHHRVLGEEQRRRERGGDEGRGRAEAQGAGGRPHSSSSTRWVRRERQSRTGTTRPKTIASL